jgi:hypothetical protein
VDRLVLERVATLEEIDRYWSMGDVMEFNEWLDAREEARWQR